MVFVNCKCGNVMEVLGLYNEEGKYVTKSRVFCSVCGKPIITDHLQ